MIRTRSHKFLHLQQYHSWFGVLVALLLVRRSPNMRRKSQNRIKIKPKQTIWMKKRKSLTVCGCWGHRKVVAAAPCFKTYLSTRKTKALIAQCITVQRSETCGSGEVPWSSSESNSSPVQWMPPLEPYTRRKMSSRNCPVARTTTLNWHSKQNSCAFWLNSLTTIKRHIFVIFLGPGAAEKVIVAKDGSAFKPLMLTSGALHHKISSTGGLAPVYMPLRKKDIYSIQHN